MHGHGSNSTSRLFFATPEQRAALARERFFEDGELPSGLVNDAVLQSWFRCNAAGQRTRDRIVAEPLSPLRVETALRRSRQLRQAAASGLARLESALAGTACQILLTNPDGVIICVGRRAAITEEVALPALAKIGMDLSERTMGTTAPGIVRETGRSCAVLANEHFNDSILRVHCAAAPIHDVDGRLAGVLDLSVEGRGFGFDAQTLLGVYAVDIENQLLRLQSEDLLVFRFQTEPFLLETPMCAMAGVDELGIVRWINSTGSRLTGSQRGDDAESAFGLPLGRMQALLHQREPMTIRMPNGLHVWLRAALPSCGPSMTVLGAKPTPAKDAATPIAPVVHAPHSAPASDLTLQQASAGRIAQALLASDGNVASAARSLGVSRGLVYRHIQRSSEPPRKPGTSTPTD